ncbi:hypothetical protein FDUTEX481_09427 [Tolypothrix sp. PCC 7601]|nr:hypothetical protein FDUTEX481_09427 [Tolypothrix sp. PCC 7601]
MQLPSMLIKALFIKITKQGKNSDRKNYYLCLKRRAHLSKKLLIQLPKQA